MIKFFVKKDFSLCRVYLSMDSYEKILETKIDLRDTYDHFRPYSASDIKALIAANLKNKREPAALVRLYKLESMIGELRTFLRAERDLAKASGSAGALAEPLAEPQDLPKSEHFDESK
jgi:hypothetical protein